MIVRVEVQMIKARKYRIEIAVITEEVEWDKVGEIRDTLEKKMRQVSNISEGLSSSITPFNTNL